MENEMRNGCSNSLVQEAGAASKSGQACMEAVERHVLHTYNRYPIVFARGEGVYLYDTEGKQYLDTDCWLWEESSWQDPLSDTGAMPGSASCSWPPSEWFSS